MVRYANVLPSVIVTIFCTFPLIASAHAFGQQYTLPLPFNLYALGASCALIASFAFLGLYSAPEKVRETERVHKSISIQGARYVEFSLRTLGMFIFLALIVTAFFGTATFISNPAPYLFWALMLLGFVYLSVFVGNWWPAVSPFEALARFLALIAPQAKFQYPKWLGFIPAIFGYYAVVWFELLSNGAGAVPNIIGTAILSYVVITLLGVFTFGIEDWFTYADFFAVFFGVIGRFAPVQYEKTHVKIVSPGEGLVTEAVPRLSLLMFILFMLASTAFDGLQDTAVWWNTLYNSSIQIYFYGVERDIIFLLAPFIFLVPYALAIYLMKLFARAKIPFSELMLRFGYSLVPIAIAYNFAHYFTLFVNSMQTLYALASDPLGRGWNLFGTAQYQTNIGLIGAKAVWYSQFGAIVLGHIIATYIAHRVARREFSSRKQVLLGQLPMLLLMVLYTVFGLWILAQAYQSGA